MGNGATIYRFAIAGSILGALAGLVAQLAGLVGSSGLLFGFAIGLVLGLGLGWMQARHDTTAGTPAPKHAGYMSLGIAFLALSAFAFVGALLVPGLRPLIVAGTPIKMESRSSTVVSFSADVSAPYAVVLSRTTGGGKDMVSQYLAEKNKGKSKELELTRDMIEWTVEPPDAKLDRIETVFQTPGAKQTVLGSIEAKQGVTYTISPSVVKPVSGVDNLNTRIEVHRSMAGWAKAFPRVLGAGAIGVVTGITGMMLLAYGGLLLYNSKQAAAAAASAP